jgi:hypothetical protein
MNVDGRVVVADNEEVVYNREERPDGSSKDYWWRTPAADFIP